MKRLFAVSVFTIVSFCFSSNTLANPLVNLSENEAEGKQGHIYEIELYRNHGINISLIHTGLTVKNAWLDDSDSRVKMRFDGRLCDSSTDSPCTVKNGAKVLHLELSSSTREIVYCAPTTREYNTNIHLTPYPPNDSGTLNSPPPQNFNYPPEKNDCSPSENSTPSRITLTLLAEGLRDDIKETKLFIFYLIPRPDSSSPKDLAVIDIEPEPDLASNKLPQIKYYPLESQENVELESQEDIEDRIFFLCFDLFK